MMEMKSYDSKNSVIIASQTIMCLIVIFALPSVKWHWLSANLHDMCSSIRCYFLKSR